MIKKSKEIEPKSSKLEKDSIFIKTGTNIKTINITNTNINNITYDPNYLDNICEIIFTQKDEKEINITKENFNILEKHINEFLEDKNIEIFYENHFEKYNKLLYPFISFIEKRQSEIEKIIPIYDNRKNINSYPIIYV